MWQADGSITIGEKEEKDSEDSDEAERARLHEQLQMSMKLEQVFICVRV